LIIITHRTNERPSMPIDAREHAKPEVAALVETSGA
jgi:hypothetical protein